ncbi:MAG: hypothetical protein FWE82_06595, partial [Defluviitaleaceae bacterium]|nr:hypothetical protein [Defluviitaleaceae bacterium]
MKKFLAFMLVFTLLLSLVVPAMASAKVTATASVKGNDVTIVVTEENGDKITQIIPNGFVKSGAATFDVGVYKVKVEFTGNGVKNVTVVVTPPLSPAPPAAGLPNNGGSSGQDNLFGGVTLKQYNNANFHCNASGNGRVWTTLGKNVTQKLNAPLHFVANTGQPVSNQANKQTAWHLVHEKVYICEECGSAEWVTFSNNSGLPDGGNVQMNHPGEDIEILKVWLDAEGNVISSKNLSAKFSITWTGADNKAREMKNVGPGKYWFPTDLIENIVVKETSVTKNYTLINIEGRNVVGVISGQLADGKISFTNKEDPYALVKKFWDLGDDKPIKEGGSVKVTTDDKGFGTVTTTVTARFDIYTLGVCDTECEEDCEL